MTRTEVLTARGYDPEVVNGHQAEASPDLSPVGDNNGAPVPVAEALEPEGPGRRCSECDGPVPVTFPVRRTTCSSQCSQARTERQKHAKANSAPASVVADDQGRAAPGEEVLADPWGRPVPVAEVGITERALPVMPPVAPLDGLLGAVAALSVQLPAGWRLEASLAGASLHWAPA